MKNCDKKISWLLFHALFIVASRGNLGYTVLILTIYPKPDSHDEILFARQ
jgi:hypothetical protein